MHNDNVLAMRFTEQHITPAALTLSAALFILHPSCSRYSVLSSPLFCFSLCSYFFSLTPKHLSFTLSTQLHFSWFFFSISLAKLSVFPRPHLSVISASLPLSLSFDSPLPHGYISLPLSLSSCSLRPLGDCRYLHKSLNFDP